MADLLGLYIHSTLLIIVSFDKLHTVCFDSFFGSHCSGIDLLIKKHILWILDEASLGFSIYGTEKSMEIWVDVVIWISIYTCSYVPDIRSSTGLGTIPLALGVATAINKQ